MSKANARPAVSLIIPCFNRAALIGRAIESALVERTNVEVIVIDDGSTDSSWDQITAHQGVRAFRTDNRGPSATRNFGLFEARGRYVRFLDSDDRVVPGSTDALLKASRILPPGHIVFGDAVVVDEAGRPSDRVAYGFADCTGPGLVDRRTLLSAAMHIGLPLFPRSSLLDAGGFDETIVIGEDYDLTVRLLGQGFQFVRVPVAVYEVCDHPADRLSRRLGAVGYQNLWRMFLLVWANVRDHVPPPSMRERQAIASFIWIQARNASRDGFAKEATDLFCLAREIAGARAFAASPLSLRLLYRFLDPNAAEAALGVFKRLRARLITS